MTTLGASPVNAAHTVIDSPCGPLTLVAADGALAGLYMTDHRHQPPLETFGPRSDLMIFDRAAEQLTAYFAGESTTFDLDLHAAGTPFQQRVWAALRTIPYGETITYGELAESLGQPTASRAVGLANGRNPISIIVPCHRVIGANGSMTGYGGGISRKQWLLDFERGAVQPTLL
ncbi:methylated-DNA--[protein]-cysteine S-methyltransferase [Actinacidiphila yeochonensis]|uniref:methylated-DNA--[protein]-cysteine S-methyltransferase n=1 Tax=Actinacidiphila yeochonensis TaxID=89050 RepID=UPI00068D9760|nr:methylated-DNA--[protein]-cysteine S-methyltransferase [Actinacidiphila yeochonensis]